MLLLEDDDTSDDDNYTQHHNKRESVFEPRHVFEVHPVPSRDHVSGKKMVEITVRYCMLLFCLASI